MVKISDRRCDVCGGENHAHLLDCERAEVSEDGEEEAPEVWVSRCRECQLKFDRVGIGDDKSICGGYFGVPCVDRWWPKLWPWPTNPGPELPYIRAWGTGSWVRFRDFDGVVVEYEGGRE